MDSDSANTEKLWTKNISMFSFVYKNMIPKARV